MILTRRDERKRPNAKEIKERNWLARRTLALILTFSPRRRNSNWASPMLWITVRQIQPQVFRWDGERFSFSLGRRPG